MSTYQPLISSVLSGYIYDEKGRQLELYLRSGQTRVFNGVPKSTVARLAKAKSAGRFYMTHIRSRYRLVKQEREETSLSIQNTLPAGMRI